MINSPKKKAIDALKKQKAKLDDKKYYNDWDWIAQTTDIISKYIGKDSALYTAIIQFKFGVLTDGSLSNEQIRHGFDAKVRTAKRYVDNCIEYIELNGIKKETKVNLLQKLSDKVVWSIFVGIATFGFFLGNFLKKVEIDKEKIKLEEQVKSLSKQVEDYQLIISNNHQTPKPKKNDNQNENN